jgi:SAM-dependent methyltransferase
MAPVSPSFRDPAGRCFIFHQRVLRFVTTDALAAFEQFLQSDCARRSLAQQKLAGTRRLNDAEAAQLRENPELRSIWDEPSLGAVFEHERLSFRSYPHEWPPEMLWAAGALTLDLGRAALSEGFGLKDATPHNILFRGSEPVFIDALSFEPRHPADPIWLPEAQFIRTFLLPLLAQHRWGIPLADVFTTHRDGLEPEAVYRLCGPLEKFTPRMLALVSIPTWLSRKSARNEARLYRPRRLANAEKARFILESLFRRLERALRALEPAKHRDSTWSNYMSQHSYDEPAFAAKEKFVAEVLREFQPARVLDAGANTGHFSALAAETGAEVVAVDADAACVGAIWRRACEKKLNILPLVVNLARPSPALGWRYGECPSFLERAAGAFDGVLMLAVIHHLLVTERIPLEEILRLVGELTRSWVVLEWIEPEDEMFRHLTRGRDSLHASLTVSVFERACSACFDIVRSLPLPGTQRRMYCLKRKDRGR